MLQRLCAILLFLLLACREGGARRVDPPPPPPICGDGKIDEGEQCDGSNFAEHTCLTLGYESGQLGCDQTCAFIKSGCFKKCGNGALDANETCDGRLGVPVCTTYGAHHCTDDCRLDSSDCITQAFEQAPELSLANGGPAVIGDVPPRGSPELVMAVPSRNRVELFNWDTVQGFQPMTARKVSFDRTPVACVAADLNSDGNLDVGTINDQGAFDAYLSNGVTFSLLALDGGCAAAGFAGVANVAPRSDFAVAVGCGAAFTLQSSGVRRVAVGDAGVVAVADFDRNGIDDVVAIDSSGEAVMFFPGPDFALDAGLHLGVLPTAFALGDLDQDNDSDLAAVVGSAVKLYENTGTAGFAERLSFSARADSTVHLRDFDLDGQLDVAFLQGNEVVVRRNRGQWAFSEFKQAVGAGPLMSVAVGDVDADGDLDVAVTFSTGTDSVRTAVARNRAR